MRQFAISLAMALCALLAAHRSHAGEETIRLKPGAGRDLTTARCVICHSLDYIPMNAPVMDRAAWEKTVRKMISAFGAPITDEETGQILEYLSEQYSSLHRSPAP